MRELENDLRQALRRQDPPDGFTDRVMARIPQRPVTGDGKRRWLAKEVLAMAAGVCLAVVGGATWEQHQRQTQGEKARNELIYALTMASETLETTKDILTR